MQRSFKMSVNGMVPFLGDLEEIFKPIEHVETYTDEGELIPGAITKWEEALQSIGLRRVAEYPVDKYGCGCTIFQVEDGDSIIHGYEFLACLDLYYDEPIYVALRNAMEYIEFHAIIRPMLMLQSEGRFMTLDRVEDQWDGGTYRKGFELKGSIAERG